MTGASGRRSIKYSPDSSGTNISRSKAFLKLDMTESYRDVAGRRGKGILEAVSTYRTHLDNRFQRGS